MGKLKLNLHLKSLVVYPPKHPRWLPFITILYIKIQQFFILFKEAQTTYCNITPHILLSVSFNSNCHISIGDLSTCTDRLYYAMVMSN